jgi:small subunit ribosomal protein S2
MLTIPSIKELFKAGAHYGHGKSKTDARSHDNIFTYRNKVAVIDLEKTRAGLEKALEFITSVAKEGGQFIFVGTKIQAKDKVKETAEALNQSYVVDRWPGGLLTNWDEVSKSIKKMVKIEEDLSQNKYDDYTKKERLLIQKDLDKKRLIFGGLKNLTGRPQAVIVFDAKEEQIAINEAKQLGIEVVGVCDTNSNPKAVDYPIPANDDSPKTIDIILGLTKEAIAKNFKPKAVETDAKTDERVEKALESKPSATSGQTRDGEKGEKAQKSEVKKKVVAKTVKKINETVKK